MQLTRSVEQFIKEARAEVTASQLLQVSQGTMTALPEGTIVTNLQNSELANSLLNTKFEVSRLSGKTSDRRLDMQWSASENRWVDRDDLRDRIYRSGINDAYALIQAINEKGSRGNLQDVCAPSGQISVDGLDDYYAVIAHDVFYILPDTPIAKLFQSADSDEEMRPAELVKRLLYMEVLSWLGPIDAASTSAERFFRQLENQVPQIFLGGREDLDFAIAVTSNRPKIYDPFAWGKRNSQQ